MLCNLLIPVGVVYIVMYGISSSQEMVVKLHDEEVEFDASR